MWVVQNTQVNMALTECTLQTRVMFVVTQWQSVTYSLKVCQAACLDTETQGFQVLENQGGGGYGL